jgi:hemoglobin/transferrin/lactoferrin receptor protein
MRNLQLSQRRRLARHAALAMAIATITAAHVHAQDSVREIVVVGSTTNTVITPDALQKSQASDLADVFRQVPSVSVGGSLGIAQKIYIRGLEDTLLNITVDGAQQTGTLFHHIGRVAIEPELLKEVEVQAGAGEATSGAGAIGGAIRFRTKDAGDLLRRDQRAGALVKLGHSTNDAKQGSVSAYGRLNDDWGVLGLYSYVDRDNMEDGDGNELYGTSAQQDLAFVKLSGDLTENQQLSVSIERRQEEGEFGARPNWPTLEGDTLFPMEGERQTIVLNHRLAAGNAIDLETTLYQTQSEIVQNRFDRWGRYGADIDTQGFDIRNTTRLGAHSLTYGVDYRNDQVTSQYLDDPSVWSVWAWDPDTGLFAEEGSVTGVYLQDHWQLTPDLLLSFGARFDRYELDQETLNDDTDSDGISPNVGLSYNLTDTLKLTAGYAEALRGKEIGDAFTLEAAPGATTIAADLDPERVENTEIGLEYTSTSLLARLSVYRSDINDVILDQQGRGVYYENVGQLESTGFEAMVRYQAGQFRFDAGFNNNTAELNGETVEGYEHIGLANERGDTWNLGFAYTYSPALEMGWNVTHVRDLNNIDVLQRSVEIGWIDSTRTIDKPGYTVHDLYLQWVPLNDSSLTVNLAVQNATDELYRDHSSVGDYNHIAGWEGIAGLYEAGRDVRLSLSYQF